MAEIKKEYYLDLIKIQEKGVKLMYQVKNILDTNNIPFWIEYGTALGAIREKRFIPWDSEIDIGLLEENLKDKEQLLVDIEKAGLRYSIAPDRIKLINPEWTVGSFTADLHIYRTTNDQAIISYGEVKDNMFKKLLNKLDWILSLHDISKTIYYRYFKIIKLLNTHYDVYSEIPSNKVKFVPGRYFNENCFDLEIDGLKLKSEIIKEATTFLTRWGIYSSSMLSNKIIVKLRKAIKSMVLPHKYDNKYQVFPKSGLPRNPWVKMDSFAPSASGHQVW